MLGNARNLGRWHKQEQGGWIDEAMDEPGASDAHNLWSPAGHPDRSSLIVARWNLRRLHQRLTIFAPGIVAAFKGLGLKALVAKPRCDGMAHGLAALAQHDDGLSAVSSAPAFNANRCVALGGRNQSRIGLAFLVCTHIGEHRRSGQPDKAA